MKVEPRATKIPMWQQAIAFHKEIYPDDYGLIVKDEHYYPTLAALLIERRKRKIYSCLDMEPLPSSLMMANSAPVVVRGKNGHRLMFGDASGAFRVRLSKEDVIHIVRCRLNKNVATEYAIGTRRGMLQLHNLCTAGVKKLRRTLPRKGVWQVGLYDDLPYYAKVRGVEVQEAARFASHPVFATVEADLEQFFGEIGYYTRYGQSGMRKILLSGPPGTGKTTIGKALAAKHHGRMVFIQADGATFAQVCYDAEKWRVPTVIMAEEVEQLYQPGAAMLSFLDGMKTPRNPAGTYVIFSTNHPKEIDPRIMKRPGRLDRVIAVGGFGRKAAAACARMYLPENCAIAEPELGAILDRSSPAEIKEIVVIALGITRAAKRELDGEVLRLARKYLSRTLKEGVEVCDEDMDLRSSEYDRLGARPDYSELVETI